MSVPPDTPPAGDGQNLRGSQPNLAAHPDRLATLAHLFGLKPVDPKRCRVLELGCADGGNLIPMALALPDSEFLGIDSSAERIDRGNALIGELGLGNIQLRALDMEALDASLGMFEYIIAHGVYSRIDDAARDALLDACRQRLAPEGIAYISYNVLPGWSSRDLARAIVRPHVARVADPAQRAPQAKAILGFVARSVAADQKAYTAALNAELARIDGLDVAAIEREYLGDAEDAVYFQAFAGRAARHGLAYLGDADMHTMLTTNLATDIQQTLARIAPDVVGYEQFVDFIRNRSHRKSLLVHQGQAISRDLDPERLMSLHVGATLKPVNAQPNLAPGIEESFRALDNVSLTTSDPVAKAALSILARDWPRTLAFEDLFRAALSLLKSDLPGAYVPPTDAKTALATSLLNAYGFGGINLQRNPFVFAEAAGERPMASRLARRQVAQGRQRLTNLRHMPVDLDPALLRLVALLDGSRDLQALTQAYNEASAGETGGITIERLAQALAHLAKLALLER